MNVDPRSTLEELCAEWGGGEHCELAALLSATRALAMLHQSNHWRAFGDPFYGDHLLYERVYGAVDGDIDSIAERLVGLAGDMMIDPVISAAQAARILQDGMQTVESSPDDMVRIALEAEMYYLDMLEAVVANLESKGLLSYGTDNMLAGIADKHEGLVYLLKRRTPTLA